MMLLLRYVSLVIIVTDFKMTNCTELAEKKFVTGNLLARKWEVKQKGTLVISARFNIIASQFFFKVDVVFIFEHVRGMNRLHYEHSLKLKKVTKHNLQ